MTQHTPNLDVRFLSERSGWIETTCDLCGETILESELRFIHRDQIMCENCGEKLVQIKMIDLARLRQDKTELLEMAEEKMRQFDHYANKLASNARPGQPDYISKDSAADVLHLLIDEMNAAIAKATKSVAKP